MNDQVILNKLRETPEYRKMEENVSRYTTEQWEIIKDQYLDIVNLIIECKNSGELANSERMRELIELWRTHINEFYYTCDKARMRSYYKLYKDDSNYKKQIEELEPGLSDYMAEAIDLYLKEQN